MSDTTDTAAATETAPPPDADAQTGAGAVERVGTPRWRRVLRYVGMPLFLLAVLVGLYLWVQGQELDSIETRELQASSLIQATQEHIWLTVLSTAIVIALAVPLGILITRPVAKRFAGFVVGLGNAGQAIPSLGLLALLFYAFQQVSWLPATGRTPVIAGLVAYSFLPILRNTMVGLQAVDADMLEAGRGMGMSNLKVLRIIELPLSVPVILAGVRTALVLNVGTASLAFLFGAGALGGVIFSGFQLRRTPVLVVGAVLVAVLALLVDYVAGLIEDWLTPKGL